MSSPSWHHITSRSLPRWFLPSSSICPWIFEAVERVASRRTAIVCRAVGCCQICHGIYYIFASTFDGRLTSYSVVLRTREMRQIHLRNTCLSINGSTNSQTTKRLISRDLCSAQVVIRYVYYCLLVRYLWTSSKLTLNVQQTAAAISIVVLAAAAFPEAQVKVQRELDLLIAPGKGWSFRLFSFFVDLKSVLLAPTFGDESMLPQTQAFILETYRWRPVVAGGICAWFLLFFQCHQPLGFLLGIPHRATKDIVWVGLHAMQLFWGRRDRCCLEQPLQRNYCIPAGASVVGNSWSVDSPNIYSTHNSDLNYSTPIGLSASIRQSFPILRNSIRNVGWPQMEKLDRISRASGSDLVGGKALAIGQQVERSNDLCT